MIDIFKEELEFFKILSDEVAKKYLGELLPFSLRMSNLKSSYGCASVEPQYTKGELQFLDVCLNPKYLFIGNNLDKNIATMIHETIHVYCRKNDIKEVSNNFRYHNKRFEELAKRCGLLTEKDKTIGVTTPGITQELKKWIEENDLISKALQKVKMKPLNKEQETKTSKKAQQSFVAYICPECGASIRAKRGMNILCGDCDCNYIEK